MKVIRSRPDEDLVALARGIVRSDYLVVDDDPLWITPMLFMAEAITETRNIGMILVPVKARTGGWWMNGKVPSVVLEIVMVNVGDTRKVTRLVATMNEALWPAKVPAS